MSRIRPINGPLIDYPARLLTHVPHAPSAFSPTRAFLGPEDEDDENEDEDKDEDEDDDDDDDDDDW